MFIRWQRKYRIFFIGGISLLFLISMYLLASKIPKESLDVSEKRRLQPISSVLLDQKIDFANVKPLPVLENPVWFIQITDLHLDINSGVSQKEHLNYFLNSTLSIIKPSTVIVTGDLTKSVTDHGLSLSENPIEWEMYRNLLLQVKSKHPSLIWLDIPGNHDNFNQENLNYYNMYRSIKNNNSIPVTRVRYGTEASVSFIPIDASLNPGLRSFNFLGHITEEKCNQIRKSLQTSMSKEDVVILYGHFTTSTIVSDCNLHDLFSKATAYLCGHLHDAYGLTPRSSFWTTQSTGFNEIELADWKNSHRYRLFALDGNEMSWIDLDNMVWPAVLVTGITITKENRRPISEIRLLVFSDEVVQAVRLGSSLATTNWIICDHLRGPVYVGKIDFRKFGGPWNKVKIGILRYLEVRLEFDSGKTVILTPSSPKLSALRAERSLVGVLLLTNKIHLLCLLVYLASIGFCLSLTQLGRKYNKKDGDGSFLPENICKALINMTKDKNSYILLLLFILYPLIGPWYIGKIAGDLNGAVFFWSIFVEGHDNLPGQLTYHQCIFLALQLQVPFFLILIAENCIDNRNSQQMRMLNVILIVIVLMQMPSIIGWLLYDSIAHNGPLRSALLIVGLILWFRYR